jgi:chromosome segregation ATPase
VSEAEELLQRMSDQQLKASDEGTSKILQIKKSIDAHIKEFMHEEAIIVQLEKNNNELETAIQTVESNIKDKVGELDELTTLSEDLDAQHNSYLAAIANEMSESETKLAEIKNTIEEKRLEVEKLTKNISNSKGEIETLKAVFLETLYKKLLHSEIEKTAAKRIDDNEQALKALNRKFEEVNAKSQSETEDLKRDYKKKIEAKKLEAESKLRHRQKIDEELKVSKGLLEKEFPWYSDYNLKLAEAELRAKKAVRILTFAEHIIYS